MHLAHTGIAVLTRAEAMIAHTQEAMAIRNKARLEHPRFNIWEAKPDSTEFKIAHPVEYDGDAAGKLRARQESRDDELASVYSIPKDLALAAKTLVESTDQKPHPAKHAELAENMRSKYASSSNDTNVPESLDTPYGRLCCKLI